MLCFQISGSYPTALRKWRVSGKTIGGKRMLIDQWVVAHRNRKAYMMVYFTRRLSFAMGKIWLNGKKWVFYQDGILREAR